MCRDTLKVVTSENKIKLHLLVILAKLIIYLNLLLT